MGGFTSKTQQDLKIYLQRDYDIQNYPFIINKLNKKKVFVHQITTDSRQEAQKIRHDVNLYKHLGCKSINVILEYIPLQSSKICSEQEYHYILEEREQIYDLKEQFLARKYYKETFSKEQIINIIKTYLCGLQVFHKQFHRDFKEIGFDSITIDETHSNQLRMTDPFLMASSASSHLNFSSQQPRASSHSLSFNEKASIFEAPERIQQKKTRFNENKIQLNQLLADIYTVGVIALQLSKMELFQKKQTNQTLQNELQKIKDLELKNILSVMIALKPEQRGKVYQMMKVSGGEVYCLQKSYRKGNLKQDASLRTNVSQNPRTTIVDLQKKNNSFSFGGSFDYKQPVTNQNITSKSNFRNYFVMSESVKGANNREIHNERQKPIESQPYNFDLKLLSKQTTSNQSTERTFNQPALSTQRSSSKPTVKFTHSDSVAKVMTNFPVISNDKNATLKTYPSTSVNFESFSYYVPKTGSLKDKYSFESRPNSFLFNDNYKLPLKNDIKQSFSKKKNQNFSPISHYRQSQEKNTEFSMTDKLNKNPLPQNSPSPNKIATNKKIEQQMISILKEPLPNQIKSTYVATPLSHIINISPIPQHINDSPINTLETNQVTKFPVKEKTITQQNQVLIGENLPIYRPNKEVEEILRKLGIGSLLYGEEKKENQNDTNFKQEKRQQKLSIQQSFESNSHQGIYKIKDISKHQVNNTQQNFVQYSIEQSSKGESNQVTPVRLPKKPKFNSTIVQVGDEDSQCSGSVHNNDENAIDLTQHEFVVEEYQTGSKYEGYKLNGQRDGEGKFYYQDGGYYEGQWKANKMHGWGRLYYEGGKLAYQGNWSQDEFHGFGKVYNDNPVQLECGFDFTNFDLLQDYWEYYEGMLVKDTKQGRGKIMLTNCEMFEGDFHNDRIQGFGKFFMKDGTTIQGIWRDSKLIKIIS